MDETRSIPVMLVLMFGSGELEKLRDPAWALTAPGARWLALSCIVGTGISCAPTAAWGRPPAVLMTAGQQDSRAHYAALLSNLLCLAHRRAQPRAVPQTRAGGVAAASLQRRTL